MYAATQEMLVGLIKCSVPIDLMESSLFSFLSLTNSYLIKVPIVEHKLNVIIKLDFTKESFSFFSVYQYG